MTMTKKQRAINALASGRELDSQLLAALKKI
jgi:hypothetical protein